jgi:hypothetical protein
MRTSPGTLAPACTTRENEFLLVIKKKKKKRAFFVSCLKTEKMYRTWMLEASEKKKKSGEEKRL